MIQLGYQGDGILAINMPIVDLPVIGEVKTVSSETEPNEMVIYVHANPIVKELDFECHFDDGRVKFSAKIEFSSNLLECKVKGLTTGHHRMDVFSSSLNMFLARGLAVYVHQ